MVSTLVPARPILLPRQFAPGPDADLTRRRFLGSGAALGGALVLGGCADDESDVSGPTPTPTAATRGFVDVTGETIQVPTRPERIVAIHDINGGAQVLSLGGPLVGISGRADGARADLTKFFDLSGLGEVGNTYEPNLEAIVALGPDLIVGEGFDGKGMGQFMAEGVDENLAKIAPVVYIDVFRPVEEVMADYAELLGEAATIQVEDQRAQFESALDELRAVLGDRWAEVTAANVASGEMPQVLGPTTDVWNDLLTRLGVTWVAVVEESGEGSGYLAISLERLEELESDLLVVEVTYDQTILSSDLYQALEVVEAGQAILLTEASGGQHWRNYTDVANRLRERLLILELDTDLV